MSKNPLLRQYRIRGEAAQVVRSHHPDGLQVQEIADRLGLSAGQINDIEAGDFGGILASAKYLNYLHPGGTWDDVVKDAAVLSAPQVSTEPTDGVIARHHTPSELLADLPSFGTMVLRVRNLQGTQEEVSSKVAHFSYLTLGRVERGREEYGARTARRICEALGMEQQEEVDPQLWLAHKYTGLGLPLRSEENGTNVFTSRPIARTDTPPIEDFLLTLPSFAEMAKNVMKKLGIKPTKLNTKCDRMTVYKALTKNSDLQMETARDICEALGMPEGTANPYAWLANTYMAPDILLIPREPSPQIRDEHLSMIKLLSDLPAFNVMVEKVRNILGSQVNVLQGASVNRTTLGRVERGGECTAQSARKICEAFGMKEKNIDPQFWLAHKYIELGLPLRSEVSENPYATNGAANDSPARARRDFLLTLPSFGDMLAAVIDKQKIVRRDLEHDGVDRSTIWKVLGRAETSTSTAREICKGLGMPEDAPNPHIWLAKTYVELGLPPVQPRHHGVQI